MAISKSSIAPWKIGLGVGVGAGVVLIVILTAALVPRPVPCKKVTPTIDSFSPSDICIRRNDQVEITATGSGFMNIEGKLPSLSFGDKTSSDVTLSDCEDLKVYRRDVSQCKNIKGSFEIPVINDPAAALDVKVVNGEPCNSEISNSILVVHEENVALTINGSSPNQLCAGTETLLTIYGTGFTHIDQVSPVIRWNDRTINAESWENCTSSILANKNVTICSSVIVRVTGLGGSVNLTVSNPPPCGTSTTRNDFIGNQSILFSDSEATTGGIVVVFFIDPPVVYNGVPIQATIYTSGLTYPAATIVIEHSNGTRYNYFPVDLGNNTNYNKILVNLNPGVLAGNYKVYVMPDARQGCGMGSLDNALRVVGDTNLTILSVSPAAVWNGDYSSVTIQTAIGSNITGIPRIYITPNPNNVNTQAASLQSVVVSDSNTLAAVLKPNIQSNSYDVLIITSDGRVGIIPKGLRVTDTPPPVIQIINPGSVLASSSDFNMEIIGNYFPTNISDVKIEVKCATVVEFPNFPRTYPVTVKSVNLTKIIAGFNGNAIGDKSVCIVIIYNLKENTSFSYNSISCYSNSANQAAFKLGPNLNVGRNQASLTSVRVTDSSRYIYVVGGNDAQNNGISSIESANIDIFGKLNSWTFQRNSLPTPLTASGITNIGRFIYLVGGHPGLFNSSGNFGENVTRDIYRAPVLSPLETPQIDIAINIDTQTTGLRTGAFYYQVSATFGPNDDVNPNGESLPSESLTVFIPNITGIQVIISWDAVEGASGYRIYRTINPNSDPSSLTLIGTTSNIFFVDIGGSNISSETPLPPGSLGKWYQIANLTTPRSSLGVVGVPLPGTTNQWYLYAFGGRSNTTTWLNSFEYSVVTATNSPGSRQRQSLSPFTQISNSFATPLADIGALYMTNNDNGANSGGQLVPGINGGDSYVYIGPGTTTGGTATSITYASTTPVQASSGNLTFVQQNSISNDYINTCFGKYPGHLAVYGGFNGNLQRANSAQFSTPTVTGGWTAGISLQIGRRKHACVREAAFLYIASGENGGGITNTTEFIFA